MEIIKVPDIDGPTAQLCWKQSRLMTRCDRRKGHGGLHSWEHAAGHAPASETPTVDKTVERLNMLHRSMGNVRSVLDRVQACRTPDHDAQDRMVGDWQEQVILAIGELTEPSVAASETPTAWQPKAFAARIREELEKWSDSAHRLELDEFEEIANDLDAMPPPASETGQASAWQPKVQQVIDEMRATSEMCDEANGTSDYNMRLVALALISREFLRRLPLAPSEDETTRRGDRTWHSR